MLTGKGELWMDRHAGNFDALGCDSVIDKLLARFVTGDQIELHIITRPTFPESIIWIGNHSHERDAIGQAQLFQNSREHVLRERMNADDDVWTPTLKLAGNISNGAFVEEFAPLGPEAIDGPIKVFHPVLSVAQDPVIDRN